MSQGCKTMHWNTPESSEIVKVLPDCSSMSQLYSGEMCPVVLYTISVDLLQLNILEDSEYLRAGLLEAGLTSITDFRRCLVSFNVLAST